MINSLTNLLPLRTEISRYLDAIGLSHATHTYIRTPAGTINERITSATSLVSFSNIAPLLLSTIPHGNERPFTTLGPPHRGSATKGQSNYPKFGPSPRKTRRLSGPEVNQSTHCARHRRFKVDRPRHEVVKDFRRGAVALFRQLRFGSTSDIGNRVEAQFRLGLDVL